jgi:hypothetical protein
MTSQHLFDFVFNQTEEEIQADKQRISELIALSGNEDIDRAIHELKAVDILIKKANVSLFIITPSKEDQMFGLLKIGVEYKGPHYPPFCSTIRVVEEMLDDAEYLRVCTCHRVLSDTFSDVLARRLKPSRYSPGTPALTLPTL